MQDTSSRRATSEVRDGGPRQARAGGIVDAARRRSSILDRLARTIAAYTAGALAAGGTHALLVDLGVTASSAHVRGHGVAAGVFGLLLAINVSARLMLFSAQWAAVRLEDPP